MNKQKKSKQTSSKYIINFSYSSYYNLIIAESQGHHMKSRP